MVSIEPITAASTVTFREVRLSALKDSPTAFGSTYVEELKLSDVEWQQRAERCSGVNSGYSGLLQAFGEDLKDRPPTLKTGYFSLLE